MVAVKEGKKDEETEGEDEDGLRLVELYAKVSREGGRVGKMEGMWLSCLHSYLSDHL